MIMVAFISLQSSWAPLIEARGLCSSEISLLRWLLLLYFLGRKESPHTGKLELFRRSLETQQFRKSTHRCSQLPHPWDTHHQFWIQNSTLIFSTPYGKLSVNQGRRDCESLEIHLRYRARTYISHHVAVCCRVLQRLHDTANCRQGGTESRDYF